MKKFIKILLLFMLSCLFLFVNSTNGQPVHMKGQVKIDLKLGLISNHLCLNNFTPSRRDTIYFLLHHGLNIEYITDSNGKSLSYTGHTDLHPVSVALRYAIPANDSLTSICIRYKGAYPVFDTTEALFDYKERIAFNGKTVRADANTAWYPILYEPASDIRHEDITLDITVDCDGCSAIYINGSQPVQGNKAKITSASPFPALLFAGHYDVKEFNNFLFLNSKVNEDDAQSFTQQLERIKQFYVEFTGIPYENNLVFIHQIPVAKSRYATGRAWGFVSYPSMVYAGIDYDLFAKALTDPEEPNVVVWQLLAHELAHYYFGTLFRTSSRYSPFYTESFADYFSLKVVEHFFGNTPYKKKLEEYYKEVLKAKDLVGLKNATRQELGKDIYRYRYGPLLLASLEQEIGKKKMKQFLALLFQLPEEEMKKADYDLLHSTALKAGVSPNQWSQFEKKYVLPSPSKSNLHQLF